MFEKRALFAANARQIERTKKLVLAREREISFETLGRSLSQNPLLPRGIFGFCGDLAFALACESARESFESARESRESAFESSANHKSRESAANLESAREFQTLRLNARIIKSERDLFKLNKTSNPAQDSRDSREFLKRESLKTRESANPRIHESHESPNRKSQNPQIHALIIDTSLQENIALISHARHYAPHFVIHKDHFISRYQILESLCFGADCVALSPLILGANELQMLANFARHLGLEVALLIDKNAVRCEILEFAHIFIPKDSRAQMPRGVVIDIK